MREILFIVDNLEMGGLQKVNVEIANALAINNKVELLTLRKKGNYYNTEIMQKKLVNNIFLEYKVEFLRGMNFFSKKYLRKGLVYFVTQQAKILEEFIVENKIETVVLNGMSLLFAKYLRANNPSLNIIMWIHNNANIYIDQYFKEYRTLFLECLKNATTVVALTESDKITLMEFSNNVIKINNPVTIKNDKISQLTSKIISFAGRLQMDHKGLDYLVQVASKLPEGWVISIAGDGDENSLKQLTEYISKYGASNKVLLNGALSGEHLNNHFLNSSIYIMTSRWEGMPLVLAEAMSFGLPIIAFEQSGSNEVLDNGNYGILIRQGDVEEMTNQLLQLINSQEVRKTYQSKSLTRVRDFDLNIIIKEWGKIV